MQIQHPLTTLGRDAFHKALGHLTDVGAREIPFTRVEVVQRTVASQTLHEPNVFWGVALWPMASTEILFEAHDLAAVLTKLGVGRDGNLTFVKLGSHTYWVSSSRSSLKSSFWIGSLSKISSS